MYVSPILTSNSWQRSGDLRIINTDTQRLYIFPVYIVMSFADILSIIGLCSTSNWTSLQAYIQAVPTDVFKFYHRNRV
jgi:hypothetical protein